MFFFHVFQQAKLPLSPFSSSLEPPATKRLRPQPVTKAPSPEVELMATSASEVQEEEDMQVAKEAEISQPLGEERMQTTVAVEPEVPQPSAVSREEEEVRLKEQVKSWVS